MAINVGGMSGLPAPFRKSIKRVSGTQGFRFPAPYDPWTGHNLPLVQEEDDDMIAVAVIERVDDADYAYAYDCFVLDNSGVPTSRKVRVFNTSSDELAAGSVAMAWRSKQGAWWMKHSAEESAVVSEEVDFIVDRFDRGDADTLGSCWSGSGYAIRNNVAYGTSSGHCTSHAFPYVTYDCWNQGVQTRRSGAIWGVYCADSPSDNNVSNNVYRYVSQLSAVDYRAKVWLCIGDAEAARTVQIVFRMKADRTSYTEVALSLLSSSDYGHIRCAVLSQYSTKADGFKEGPYEPPYGPLGYYDRVFWEDDDSIFYHTPNNGSGPGSYLFEISQTGPALTVSYDGNVLYQGVDLQAVNAGFLGLVTGSGNMLGPSGPISGAIGIEKVKVWSASIWTTAPATCSGFAGNDSS